MHLLLFRRLAVNGFMLINCCLVLPLKLFAAASLIVAGVRARRFDRVDDRWARRRRVYHGLRNGILSWSRDPDGRWRARLSYEATPRTVERTGVDRREAIGRAELAIKRLSILRARMFDENSGAREGSL